MLRPKTVKLLQQLCQALGVEVKRVGKKAPTKAQIVQALLQPDVAPRALATLMGPEAAPVFLPAAQLEVEAALAAAASGGERLGIHELQYLRQSSDSDPKPMFGVTILEPSPAAPADVQPAAAPTMFFDARAGGGKGRAALQTLKVGQTVTGHVIGISLHDGIRVDIGAEADALVPVNLSADPVLAAQVAGACPLDAKVTVRIREAIVGPAAAARRFPLLAELVQPALPLDPSAEDALPDSGTALLLGPASDPEELHELRGDGTASPGEAAVSSLVGTDTEAEDAEWAAELQSRLPESLAGRWKVAHRLPPRAPPEEVLSLGAAGVTIRVPVPPEHRVAVGGGGGGAADEAAAEAWRELAAEELQLLDAELSCRDRLAVQIAAVEADLAAGRAPAVPAELLAMVRLPCGRRCVVPVADGDCLRFRLREFEDAKALEAWAADELAQHSKRWSYTASAEVGEARRAELRRWTAMLECKDVRHARAVRRVEAEELRRAGYAQPQRSAAAWQSSDLFSEVKEMAFDVVRSLGGTILQDQKELGRRGGMTR